MYCIISHLVEYATANHMQVFSQFNFIRKFILDYNMLFLLFLFFWKPTSSLFPNKDFINWSNLDSNVLFFTISNLKRKKNLIFLTVVSLYNMLILLDIFSFFWLRKEKMISAWRADKIQWSLFQFQSSNTYFTFLFTMKMINEDMCMSRSGRLMHFFQWSCL